MSDIYRRKPKPATAPPDGWAGASLALSLLWFGGIGSLLAVIFGQVSRTKAREAGMRPAGMADWGMLLGILGLAATVIVIIWLLSRQGTPCDVNNPNWPNC